MTLTATTNKVAYAGDSSTVSFPVTFIYWEDSTVKVILSNDTTGVETTWVDGTQYTLSGGDGATGTLTVDTSPTNYTPATGETLTVKSNHPHTQTSALPLGGPMPSTTVEARLDKNVRLVQQLQEELDRTIQFPESSTSSGVTIETTLTALELLRVNSAGTGVEGVALSDLSLGLGTATKWNFDSSISMADPGTGDLRMDSATLASVTQIAVDATSAQTGNPDISDWVASWDDSTNDANRGVIMIHEDGTPSNFWTGKINGAITDNTGWLQIPVTYIDSGGSFTAADSLVVGFSPAGGAGETAGFNMLWDSDTTDADSGAGKVWFDNATLASVTVVYIDDVDKESVNINTWVDSLDDSTTSSLRGTIKVTKVGTPATYAVYNVSGAVTSASTYSKVAVTHVISNGTFTDADPVYMEFSRTGDKGIGGIGMAWESTTTDTDQGVGKVWLNHATPSSATVLYMDDVDEDSADVNAYVDTWDDSTTVTNRGTIIVREVASPANFVIFNVTGAVTSASTYSKVAVTHVATGGSMTDTNEVSVEFYRTGNIGENAGLDMIYEDTTTDTDQGVGTVFFNNATLASATIIYMDDVDANSANINTFIDSWDDSTSTVKGHVYIHQKESPAVWAVFTVSGSVTSASTYSKMTCAYVAGAGTLVDGDPVNVSFIRSGDKGDTGTASAGLHYQFETTTTDADQGAGKLWLNNATLASATILYIDDDDNDGVDVSAFTATWDDATASNRGYIKFQSRDTPTDYAVYAITGAGTDNTAYYEFPVTHQVSSGTFSDAEVIDVFFTQSGDIGAAAGKQTIWVPAGAMKATTSNGCATC
jgi:hypothetical protein